MCDHEDWLREREQKHAKPIRQNGITIGREAYNQDFWDVLTPDEIVELELEAARIANLTPAELDEMYRQMIGEKD